MVRKPEIQKPDKNLKTGHHEESGVLACIYFRKENMRPSDLFDVDQYLENTSTEG